MSGTVATNDSATTNDPDKRDDDLDLEFWKHFASMGGTDKNTMITTVSWLLAFAATAIGYIVTDSGMIVSTQAGLLQLPHPGRMMIVSSLGLLVACGGGYLALLYGGYANRNWAKADELAKKHKWQHLLPDWPEDELTPEEKRTSRSLATVAWQLARPCHPRTALAPVFTVFLYLALFAGFIHGFFLAWSYEVRFCN